MLARHGPFEFPGEKGGDFLRKTFSWSFYSIKKIARDAPAQGKIPPPLISVKSNGPCLTIFLYDRRKFGLYQQMILKN